MRSDVSTRQPPDVAGAPSGQRGAASQAGRPPISRCQTAQPQLPDMRGRRRRPFEQSLFVSAARGHRGLTFPLPPPPNRGAAERRQGALDLNGRAGKTRQPRSRGVGAPCEGARASRRSAWRFLAQARFASPALPPDPSRVLRAAGSRARRAGSQASRAGDLCRRPGRHSRSVFRIVSGDAPRRAGWATHRPYSFRSQ